MNDTAPVALKKPTLTKTHTVGTVSYPDKSTVLWNWPKGKGTPAQVIGASKTKFLIRYAVKIPGPRGRHSTIVHRAQVYPQSIQVVKAS